MSDTPRSDAAEIKVQCGFKETGTGTVPISDSRQLERELAEAHVIADLAMDRGEKLKAENAKLRAAVAWYGEEAKAIARNVAALKDKPSNAPAIMASLMVLSLDAGKRADAAKGKP